MIATGTPPQARPGTRAPALRFLFVGGGTGGHLAPALGMAEVLEARGHRVRFLGSGRGIERRFLRDDRYRSLGLDASLLPRRLALLPALLRARREARAFRPDLTVSLGGLAGAAALGARRGRPLVLLEGNRVPGRGVRCLAPFSQATLTLFPDTAAALRRGRCIGPVGRLALTAVPRAQARGRLGLPEAGPVLLVMGGSQGAEALNEAVCSWLPRLAEAGASLFVLAGPGKAGRLRSACAAAGLPAVIREHFGDMGLAYSAASLVLCRGGAATVAELWLHRVPAVVVPYPFHRDRQQERNARALEPGVAVLGQSRLAAAGAELVLRMLADPEQRGQMRRHLASTAPADGVEQAADFLEELAVRNG